MCFSKFNSEYSFLLRAHSRDYRREYYEYCKPWGCFVSNQVMHKDVVAYMNARQEHMVRATTGLANINSGSWNKDGISRVQEKLDDIFTPLSTSVERRELRPLSVMQDSGVETHFQPNDMQIFRARPEAPFQLLMTGHSDTVFPVDSEFQKCSTEGSRLHGPGTADMKGGLVVLSEALRWLEQSEWRDQFGFTVAISPDEEIGSISSAPVLMELAKEATYGLTYEPALSNGTLAGARKGSGNFTLVARGLSTHAGREFFAGRNAIVAMTNAISQLVLITSKEAGITVNIGKIQGGGAVNVVPDLCTCRFNIRVDTTEQMEVIEMQMKEIIESVEKKTGCEFQLHGAFNRPPKPMTEQQQEMFEILKECGHELNIDIQWKPTGGCCEGNNLAAAGLTNIDTLGVRGFGIHTEDEYACMDSFSERAALNAVLIQKLIVKHMRQ